MQALISRKKFSLILALLLAGAGVSAQAAEGCGPIFSLEPVSSLVLKPWGKTQQSLDGWIYSYLLFEMQDDAGKLRADTAEIDAITRSMADLVRGQHDRVLRTLVQLASEDPLVRLAALRLATSDPIFWIDGATDRLDAGSRKLLSDMLKTAIDSSFSDIRSDREPSKGELEEIRKLVLLGALEGFEGNRAPWVREGVTKILAEIDEIGPAESERLGKAIDVLRAALGDVAYADGPESFWNSVLPGMMKDAFKSFDNDRIPPYLALQLLVDIVEPPQIASSMGLLRREEYRPWVDSLIAMCSQGLDKLRRRQSSEPELRDVIRELSTRLERVKRELDSP